MESLLCSCCGKAEHQVDKLIAGQDVYICNECVDLCRAMIRLPDHLVASASEILRAERRLVDELGREPTAAEIAAASGMEPDEVESIKRSIA